MTRYYDTITQFERDGYDIIVDKTYEDIDPWDQLSECFDSKEQLYADIDSGKYEWFMLRVRVMVEGMELGSTYLGGCLYERAEEVVMDGTVEDCLIEALAEAKSQVYRLSRKFTELSYAVDAEGIEA
jgi:hypothetical protein